MAEKAATRSSPQDGIEKIAWAAQATGDTGAAVMIFGDRARRGTAQFTGTFSSTNASLRISNDGTTWAIAKDINGNAVTATADGDAFNVEITAFYVSTAVTDGTGDSVTPTLILR